ncbi:YugN-like family protein [Bacillus sp. FJAT-45350]|uniref:YugN-like family protein n=1 Tax=Bacillus sp. FJAT-45350 TaxID=2011014 RepID=UPI000BB8C32E|nr:YugN-like family protein [Bacillus sp. FJAT-45350]
MILMNSQVENKQFMLKDLEDKLKPLGYVISGNWDYEHGYFDYKLDDNGSYQYLRIPFTAVEGEIDQKGVIVKLGKPFLLAHKYQRGLDDQVMDYNSFMNQFSEPQDKDAYIPPQYVNTGKSLIQELEATLLY